jgi:hypothetical protein
MIGRLMVVAEPEKYSVPDGTVEEVVVAGIGMIVAAAESAR